MLKRAGEAGEAEEESISYQKRALLDRGMILQILQILEFSR